MPSPLTVRPALFVYCALTFWLSMSNAYHPFWAAAKVTFLLNPFVTDTDAGVPTLTGTAFTGVHVTVTDVFAFAALTVSFT